MLATAPISLKSLALALPLRHRSRRSALHAVLTCLTLFFLASLAQAQMQFNGIAAVLPINGETLGAQDHAVADQAGNVYITDPTTNQVFKVDVHGNATVLISSTTLFNNIAMSGPDGIAIDLSGNLYIADTYNDRIITIPAGGTPTLLATGIIQPTNLAVDNYGDVYVSVTSQSAVIKLTPPTESVTPVTTSPYTLNNPQGIAVDINGAVYIADTGNARVLKSYNGTTTVVSTGSIALSLPVGVTVDGILNIFIADAQNSQIVEVPSSGTPSIVGTGSEVLANPNGISFDSNASAYIMDAGNNRVVTLNDSAVNFGSVVVGGSGVTNPLTFTIDPGTQVGGTSIISGGVASADFTLSNTTCTYGTTAATCTINVTFLPKTVGVRKAALVIKTQSASQLVSLPLLGTATGPILAFTPGTFSTVAGTYNEYGAPSVGGFPIATSALLYQPKGITLDDAGNFFFLDYGNWVVREVNPAGYIYTVLGNGSSARWFDQPAEGDGGPSLCAAYSAIFGIGIDALDDIYIADYGMNQIREETGLPTSQPNCANLPAAPPAPADGYSYTVAGIWDPYYERTPYGGDGGPAIDAELTTPWDVRPDNAGNVYFSDYGNQVVRKIAPNGVITTVAGNAGKGYGYSGDGQPAVLAQLYRPSGLALDGEGNLFIADTSNNVIRKVTPEGIISTVAGNYALGAGYTGDNGPAIGAQLNGPYGLTADGGGNLYIADTGNNAIRMVTPGGTISTVAVFGPCNPPNNNDLCYTGTIPGVQNRIPVSPFGSPTGTLTYQPLGIAAAPDGNLFFTDYNGNVVDKIDVSDPPTLKFPPIVINNSSSQQDVIIQNLGTAPLNISQISISSNFVFGSDTTCSLGSATVLAQDQSCVLGIAFSPLQTGSLSGSVVITSNSQGAGGTTQTIPMSGISDLVAPVASTLVSPTPGLGTILGATNVPFEWTVGTEVTLYQLNLSTVAPGASDLFSYKGAATSVNVPTLPANGAKVYARLYSLINGAWQSIDYLYTESGAPTPAMLTSPTPGLTTVLGTSNVSFQWTAGTGVSLYQLNLSAIAPGGSDLLVYKGSGTSVIASTLPANDAKVYARLYSYISGAWQYNDYLYTETNSTVPAALTFPTPGLSTVLGTNNQGFQWNTGTGVTLYQLNLGTTAPGASDLFSYKGTATSANVPSLPANGATVYARLYSYIGGAWQYNDYLYTESGSTVPAALTSPTPGLGTILGISNVNFQWSTGTGVTDYQLNLSAVAPGGSDLYLYKGTALSTTVTTLPANGVTVYARLYSKINGTWQYNDYVYTEQ
jgi:sugar lactone lactonase YvrE